MSKVLLISPPYMILSKPSYKLPKALTSGCKYMNPGLLICSSILNKEGIDNRIIKIEDPTNEAYIKKNLDKDVIFVGISCTCAWEYLESLKIAQIIKKINKEIKIAISGWQIKSIKRKVFEDSEDIDYLILGDAEYTIKLLYKKVLGQWKEPIISVEEKETSNLLAERTYDNSNIEFVTIDFSSFPNYEQYMPYVEESRNCPFRCKFCLNSCVCDRYQNVPLDIFKKNVDFVEKLYGKKASANLLAANFGVNPTETKKKLDYLRTKELNWNIEFHVDNQWEYYINNLKECGINKASIGFESGSVVTLKRMNKTSDPVRYLFRLEELMKNLYLQDIKPSLNLLIDYRDNRNTLSETLCYLEKNKKYIHKVKANFMYAFGPIMDNLDYEFEPNIIMDSYSKKIHAFPVLPKGLSLDSIYTLIFEIEKGNYSLDILDVFQQ